MDNFRYKSLLTLVNIVKWPKKGNFTQQVLGVSLKDFGDLSEKITELKIQNKAVPRKT